MPSVDPDIANSRLYPTVIRFAMMPSKRVFYAREDKQGYIEMQDTKPTNLKGVNVVSMKYYPARMVASSMNDKDAHSELQISIENMLYPHNRKLLSQNMEQIGRTLAEMLPQLIKARSVAGLGFSYEPLLMSGGYQEMFPVTRYDSALGTMVDCLSVDDPVKALASDTNISSQMAASMFRKEDVLRLKHDGQIQVLNEVCKENLTKAKRLIHERTNLAYSGRANLSHVGDGLRMVCLDGECHKNSVVVQLVEGSSNFDKDCLKRLAALSKDGVILPIKSINMCKTESARTSSSKKAAATGSKSKKKHARFEFLVFFKGVERFKLVNGSDTQMKWMTNLTKCSPSEFQSKLRTVYKNMARLVYRSVHSRTTSTGMHYRNIEDMICLDNIIFRKEPTVDSDVSMGMLFVTCFPSNSTHGCDSKYALKSIEEDFLGYIKCMESIQERLCKTFQAFYDIALSVRVMEGVALCEVIADSLEDAEKVAQEHHDSNLLKTAKTYIHTIISSFAKDLPKDPSDKEFEVERMLLFDTLKDLYRRICNPGRQSQSVQRLLYDIIHLERIWRRIAKHWGETSSKIITRPRASIAESNGISAIPSSTTGILALTRVCALLLYKRHGVLLWNVDAAPMLFLYLEKMKTLDGKKTELRNMRNAYHQKLNDYVKKNIKFEESTIFNMTPNFVKFELKDTTNPLPMVANVSDYIKIDKNTSEFTISLDKESVKSYIRHKEDIKVLEGSGGDPNKTLLDLFDEYKKHLGGSYSIVQSLQIARTGTSASVGKMRASYKI